MSQISFSSSHSPRADMNQRISAATSAGTISQTDASALSTALDSIDSSLSSASSSGSRLDPSEMKGRVDSLISDQVANGTLTEEQAAELQSLFAQGGPRGAPQDESASASSDSSLSGVDSASSASAASGAQGPHGPRGMQGPPPPPPPSDETDGEDEEEDGTSISAASSTSSTSADIDSQFATLISALEKLRSGLASSSTYSVSDSSGSSSTATSGLIVDQMA